MELAELVGACTSTAATQGPMSFPQRHPLCGPGADTTYDYTLGLEAGGAQVSINGPGLAKIAEARDVTHIDFKGVRTPGELRPAGNREKSAMPIEADAEASLPLIIEEVKRQMTSDQKARIQERAGKHARANHDAHVTALEEAVERARAGWNGSPISTARVYAELWPLIMKEDWCLLLPAIFRAATTINFGITTSRIAISAAKARAVWVTARRHRWARHWQRRPAIDSSSTSKPMAI